tara:strand:- start:10116 stop:10829 length:714 start_codon:yes stop_codon:yes gene_type:complete
MKINTTYKILMVFTIFILSLASASGQGAYTVVLNSEYKYEIPTDVDIQTYDWKVYTNNLLTIEATALECTLTPVTGEPNSIMVEWLQEGEYYLTMDALGTNGCSNKKAWKYTVVSTPTIAFKNLTSDDCADLDPQFSTEMEVMFDSGNELLVSQYPITVNYRLDGDFADRTAIVNFADKLFQITGIIENEISNTTNNITIMSATTKFGGVLKKVVGDEVHTRTIYALPAKPIITINN